MNYSDFIYDFNLYLCERFGYRNCCSVMHNANGICVSVHVGEMDLYIRFLGNTVVVLAASPTGVLSLYAAISNETNRKI